MNSLSHFVLCQDYTDVYFLLGPDSIDFPSQRCFEDLFVKEPQCVHGLVFRGTGNMTLHGQMSEKMFNFFFPLLEVFSAVHPMELNIPLDLVDGGSLGMDGLMMMNS